MLADHYIYFAIRSVMMKWQESMSYPRKVMISLRPPLARMFRIEAGYGRLIGSDTHYKGLKMMNRDIKTISPALDTIL